MWGLFPGGRHSRHRCEQDPLPDDVRRPLPRPSALGEFARFHLEASVARNTGETWVSLALKLDPPACRAASWQSRLPRLARVEHLACHLPKSRLVGPRRRQRGQLGSRLGLGSLACTHRGAPRSTGPPRRQTRDAELLPARSNEGTGQDGGPILSSGTRTQGTAEALRGTPHG